jgi:hypothetical protein
MKKSSGHFKKEYWEGFMALHVKITEANKNKLQPSRWTFYGEAAEFPD